jgi:hypothetical protein
MWAGRTLKAVIRNIFAQQWEITVQYHQGMNTKLKETRVWQSVMLVNVSLTLI